MNTVQKRFILFLFGCIFVRSLFVIISKTYTQYLPVFGLLALLPAVGFLYIYFTHSRKTGPETFNQPIWWNNLRPIHAIFYLLFAYFAINKNKNSWLFLLADVILGLSSFLFHHYQSGSFKELIK